MTNLLKERINFLWARKLGTHAISETLKVPEYVVYNILARQRGETEEKSIKDWHVQYARELGNLSANYRPWLHRFQET